MSVWTDQELGEEVFLADLFGSAVTVMMEQTESGSEIVLIE